ncbi:glutamine--tRNA ligase/YqeY domain fusion protein [Methylophaga thalassica]|uniref:glutamine--tRNA ligase/YqeY domain fusion protein n=1 Tax=Methylophaga thalassica TaxID=40223 RepID=UPI002E7AC091|nr:glutamine--tRNA ligase/YqeY domain fusion protein [Methylophaga thalassica]WVI86092.1 glutamine--tRNA ligase/YqeY domain fusion protein [Methylophaga thalassica]
MSESAVNHNFIRPIIQEDLDTGRVTGKIVTRFPPEPNGYLHIGHAKSICLNFGLAEEFGGDCHLRFDDTNPAKEEQEFIEAIKEDVQWLGFQWAGDVRYASNYFEQFYDWAIHLIKQGKAYVCDLTAERASEYRGWATKPGKESPFRNRSVEENLTLFEKMKQGEFDEGFCVLRAKIDMASPNMNMRDPILYRIRKKAHHQTGDKWCIYPSYDFAHGQGDAIEGVTHSICTLEFQDHRPLYEWFIENLPVPSQPKQYEFGRLNLNYTVTSKRNLKQLVDEQIVAGWNDPRMPTISGMRRRGYTASALRSFCNGLAVAKTDGVVDIAQLEFEIRNDLNENAARAMCVLNPLKLTITNASDGVEWLEVANHPQQESMGHRSVPFTKAIYIDASDFSEDTSLSRKKFKRLVIGDYVRLRGAYVIKADDVIKNDSGDVVEVIASLVPNTVGQNPPAEMKPRGVIHWVSATEAKEVELRLYDRLFLAEAPGKETGNYLDDVNPDSLKVIKAVAEPAIVNCKPETAFQFEREGYFVTDRYDHTVDSPVFNLTIGLKEDTSKNN